MPELTDAQLIQRTRSGNREAFAVLFDRYFEMAKGAAYRILHDRALAEDLAQDAMLQAYLSINNLKNSDSYASWLYGIVRNLCYSHLRKQASGSAVVLDELDEWHVDKEFYRSGAQWEDDPVRVAERRLNKSAIENAIEKLAPKRKEAAALFYLEQMSIQEIAQRLAVSETAVKSRLFQARKQLQTQLSSLYFETVCLAKRHIDVEKRKIDMVKIDSVHTFTREDNQAIVLFVAKESLRCLQMWIGMDVGHALGLILKGEETPRPLTHNTMAQMVELLDATVARVEVNALKDTTFFGTIYVERNGESRQLDARPSDAVTLALVAGAPIYIADEVMAKSGRDLPSPFNEHEWLEEVKKGHHERVQLLFKWQEALSADGTKFTKRARNVCTAMMAEAESNRHNYVGTEHLLLGFVAVKDSLAGQVLADLGITYEVVEKLMKEMVGPNTRPSTEPPVMAPRLIQVFEFAELERDQRGHPYIGSEHLLLGIIKEAESETSDKQGMAIQFLQKLGVDSGEIRQKVGAAFDNGN